VVSSSGDYRHGRRIETIPKSAPGTGRVLARDKKIGDQHCAGPPALAGLRELEARGLCQSFAQDVRELRETLAIVGPRGGLEGLKHIGQLGGHFLAAVGYLIEFPAIVGLGV
jgi:hypothetical protein